MGVAPVRPSVMTAKLKLVKPTGEPPPRKLGAHGGALWRSVLAEYRLEDAAGVAMLAQAVRRARPCGAQENSPTVGWTHKVHGIGSGPRIIKLSYQEGKDNQSKPLYHRTLLVLGRQLLLPRGRNALARKIAARTKPASKKF